MSVVKEVSKGGNVTYYINQDAGVVVAKINSEESEAYEIMESIADKNLRSDLNNCPAFIYSRTGCAKYALDQYYIGIAKCSPKDKFDTEIGKKVALARAQEKYHTALMSNLSKMASYFGEIASLITCRACKEHEQIEKYRRARCEV